MNSVLLEHYSQSYFSRCALIKWPFKTGGRPCSTKWARRTVQNFPELIQHAGFIDWHHIFNVDKRIWTSTPPECVQRFLNQITDIFSFLLAVIKSITQIDIPCDFYGSSWIWLYLTKATLEISILHIPNSIVTQIGPRQGDQVSRWVYFICSE